mgnify:CR=1 FL=1
MIQPFKLTKGGSAFKSSARLVNRNSARRFLETKPAQVNDIEMMPNSKFQLQALVKGVQELNCCGLRGCPVISQGAVSYIILPNGIGHASTVIKNRFDHDSCIEL